MGIMKKFISLLLICGLTLMSISVFAADKEYGIDCGDELEWNFNSDSGTLTISGSGYMWDFYRNVGPWCIEYGNDIKNIVIDNGVNSIGGYAFAACPNLLSIYVPISMKSINNAAFLFCDNLKDVYYFGNEQDWNKIAISIDNESLTNATIHYNVNNNPTVDKIYNTDIIAYINNYAIPTYVAKDKVCIVAEDLRNFGFNVDWIEKDNRLNIYRNNSEQISEMNFSKLFENGTEYCDCIPSDIEVFVSDTHVQGYSFNGNTLIPIETLNIYGNIEWDSNGKSVSLELNDLPNRDQKQEILYDNFNATYKIAFDYIYNGLYYEAQEALKDIVPTNDYQKYQYNEFKKAIEKGIDLLAFDEVKRLYDQGLYYEAQEELRKIIPNDNQKFDYDYWNSDINAKIDSLKYMSSDEFDAGMSRGINYFNKGMYYEARDEFQWFCDANWGKMNAAQQKYALDYLGGTKAKLNEEITLYMVSNGYLESIDVPKVDMSSYLNQGWSTVKPQPKYETTDAIIKDKALTYYKSILKRPTSLELYSINLVNMESDWDYENGIVRRWVYIDGSALNGFGGYTRSTSIVVVTFNRYGNNYNTWLHE